ncbi:MAG: hypothetical protein GY951_17710 [Psychromonas sp.]|nr:hypothetical protein [Psychromonas sp.]
MSAESIAKMAALPDILEAAKTLKQYGLIEQEPNYYVKKYVAENPEINEMLQKKMA